MRVKGWFFLTVTLIGMALLVLASCGGQPTATPRATNTPIPYFAQSTATEAPALATIAAQTAVAATQAAEAGGPALNPTAVARGQGNWDKLECASCHGEQGEGGAGSIGDKEAPSLQALAFTQTEFIGWLRSGGTLGNDHLFATDRLSDGGARNLYQFVLSLGESAGD